MKLLVTGGLGFIGSNFIVKMLEQKNDFEMILNNSVVTPLSQLLYTMCSTVLESLNTRLGICMVSALILQLL